MEAGLGFLCLFERLSRGWYDDLPCKRLWPILHYWVYSFRECRCMLLEV